VQTMDFCIPKQTVGYCLVFGHVREGEGTILTNDPERVVPPSFFSYLWCQVKLYQNSFSPARPNAFYRIILKANKHPVPSLPHNLGYTILPYPLKEKNYATKARFVRYISDQNRKTAPSQERNMCL
jgi:hypothetical protein